ncbi:hypothetical protein MASR2M79_18870 [Aminivibrio sp.]
MSPEDHDAGEGEAHHDLEGFSSHEEYPHEKGYQDDGEGMKAGEPRHDDRGVAVPSGEAVLQPSLKAGEFSHSGDPRDGPGEEHDEDHVLQVAHSGEARRPRLHP